MSAGWDKADLVWLDETPLGECREIARNLDGVGSITRRVDKRLPSATEPVRRSTAVLASLR